MEFGKHIGLGMWGLAGRALPSIYGVGIILFVIRVFPPVEFGVYTLLQTIFLLTTGPGQTFALQSLAKYGAVAEDASEPVTASVILYGAFIVPAALLLLAFAARIGLLVKSGAAGELLWYVVLMLVASGPRNVAAFLLQARLDMKTLFVLDGIYSLGSLALIAWLVPAGAIGTAEGVMQVNLAMLAASSAFGVWLLLARHRVRPAYSPRALRRAWDFGRYSLGASISYTMYSQADNLIIAGIGGPVPLATYNAAKVFTRAYELFQQTINTLLVPVVSAMHGRGDRDGMKTLAEKSLFFFTIGSAGLTGVFLLFGDPLTALFYGEKYPGAAPVLRILACAGAFIPVFAVGAGFCNGVAEMKPVFYLNLLTAILGVGSMALLTPQFGIEGAAWGVLATAAAIAPLWLVVLVRRLRVPVSVRGVLGRAGDIREFIRNRMRNV